MERNLPLESAEIVLVGTCALAAAREFRRQAESSKHYGGESSVAIKEAAAALTALAARLEDFVLQNDSWMYLQEAKVAAVMDAWKVWRRTYHRHAHELARYTEIRFRPPAGLA